MRRELDRQLKNLHRLGYPALAGLSARELDAMVEPLAELLPEDGPGTGPDEDVPGAPGRIPVVLVVTRKLVPTVEAVARWSVRGQAGWTDMADEIDGYVPIEGLEVPDCPVYLLLDVDTGADTLGVPPVDALPVVLSAGRSPLTVDEGVALVTHFPDAFGTHSAFQALGSRAPNKRVPSFWVSKGAPRLGWCWAGNPHSWLGAASAGGRLHLEQ
jgi:hypothetical protein